MIKLVIGFYIFCALIIKAFFFLSRVLGHPRFRSEEGEITNEVGYEEDPQGESAYTPEGPTAEISAEHSGVSTYSPGTYH